MKKFSLSVISVFLHKIPFLFFRLKFNFATLGTNNITIFDIDNTIANTWPSLVNNNKSEKERLLSLKYFDNIAEFIRKHESENGKIVFLSARDYKYYFVTKKWLMLCGFSNFTLILVPSPSFKIILLKSVSTKSVIFWDDMSYNHEHGVVMFYTDEIKAIKAMTNVKYYDYNYLLKLQTNTNAPF